MNVKLKRDGLTLRGELLLPEKDSYDIAILMHGFTGNRNGELLTALADALLEKGVASVRFDFNGHGDSDGKLEDMTVLNEIADAKVILDYAKSLEHVRNIFLFGHSQGGVVAIGGFYFRIAQSLPIYEIASHYTGEVLLLHGDSDPIVNKIASERYHDVYKNSELHIVKGADHGFGPSMQPEATQAAVDFFCKED